MKGGGDVEIQIESKINKSFLEPKGDRAARKYLLSPQDINELFRAG